MNWNIKLGPDDQIILRQHTQNLWTFELWVKGKRVEFLDHVEPGHVRSLLLADFQWFSRAFPEHLGVYSQMLDATARAAGYIADSGPEIAPRQRLKDEGRGAE